MLVLTWRRARLQSLGNWKAQRLWKSNPQPGDKVEAETFLLKRVIVLRYDRVKCLAPTPHWDTAEVHGEQRELVLPSHFNPWRTRPHSISPQW